MPSEADDAPQPDPKRVPTGHRELNKNTESSDKIPGETFATEDEPLATERRVSIVSTEHAEAFAFPTGTELTIPCEIHPNFALLHEAHFDDDDGEQLDNAVVHASTMRELKFVGISRCGTAYHQVTSKERVGGALVPS